MTDLKDLMVPGSIAKAVFDSKQIESNLEKAKSMQDIPLSLFVLAAICDEMNDVDEMDELERQRALEAEMEAHDRRQIQAGLERAEKMRQEDAKRLAGKPTLKANMFEMAKAKKRR